MFLFPSSFFLLFLLPSLFLSSFPYVSSFFLPQTLKLQSLISQGSFFNPQSSLSSKANPDPFHLKKPIKTHLMNPRKLLAFFLFLLHLVAVENLILDFPSFNFRNLTFLGDSHIRNGVVSLTHNLSVPTSSVGVVVYNPPIRFFNPDSNIITSFSTRFTFTFSNLNLSSSCDGMSFFLSPTNSSTLIGSSGAYLTLVNASALTKEEEKHKEKKEERRNKRKRREKKE